MVGRRSGHRAGERGDRRRSPRSGRPLLRRSWHDRGAARSATARPGSTGEQAGSGPAPLLRASPIAPRRGQAHRWLAGLALLLFSSLASATLPIEHWRTSNGVPVYFVRADAIPMLDVRILFDAGGRRDPADRKGVASMVGRLLDK